MEVERRTSHDGKQTEFFIICDAQEDRAVIRVEPDELKRWQVSPKDIYMFVARHFPDFDSDPVPPSDPVQQTHPIGFLNIRGSKKLAELDLQEEATIRVAGKYLKLSRFVRWKGGKLFIDIARLEEFAEESISGHAAQSLSSHEQACAKWLADLPETPRLKKADAKKEAMEKFPGLSGRGFNRLWALHAPKSWKQKGRPKK